MRRALNPCAVLVVAFSIASTAQQNDQDPSKTLQMRSLSVFDILYAIRGGGGNTAALMADDGVVVVDTKRPGFGKALLETIESVHDAPVKTIINTHAHADHTGSNAEFPTAVNVIAHQRTRDHMAKMDAFSGANARFLPNKTFTDTMSLQIGQDTVDLYHFGAGHTDGDAIVVFRKQRVAYLGDLFPGKVVPTVDAALGGSGVALAKTLARTAAEIEEVDRVMVGHEPLSETGLMYRAMRWSDFQEYASFVRDLVAAVEGAHKAGKTAEAAASSLGLPDAYKEYDLQGARAFVEAVYRELGK
jgi:cyclase